MIEFFIIVAVLFLVLIVVPLTLFTLMYFFDFCNYCCEGDDEDNDLVVDEECEENSN